MLTCTDSRAIRHAVTSPVLRLHRMTCTFSNECSKQRVSVAVVQGRSGEGVAGHFFPTFWVGTARCPFHESPQISGGVFSPATNAAETANVARIRDSPRQSAMHRCEVRADRDEVRRPQTLLTRHMLSRRSWWRSARFTASAGKPAPCCSPTARRNVARRTLGVTTGAEPCQTAVRETCVRGWVLAAAVCRCCRAWECRCSLACC